MTKADRLAALSSISVRVMRIGDRLARVRVPVELLGELLSIRRAVDAVREDIEKSAEDEPKA